MPSIFRRKEAPPAHDGMTTVPIDAPGNLNTADIVDAQLRQTHDPALDEKHISSTTGQGKFTADTKHRLSEESEARLEFLRVDESTLVDGMRYEDLTLFEKKSVLVSRWSL